MGSSSPRKLPSQQLLSCCHAHGLSWAEASPDTLSLYVLLQAGCSGLGTAAGGHTAYRVHTAGPASSSYQVGAEAQRIFLLKYLQLIAPTHKL